MWRHSTLYMPSLLWAFAVKNYGVQAISPALIKPGFGLIPISGLFGHKSGQDKSLPALLRGAPCIYPGYVFSSRIIRTRYAHFFLCVFGFRRDVLNFTS